MMTPTNISIFRDRFAHNDDLLIVYLYKSYVFGIVKKEIADLRLPQITMDEVERIFKGSANTGEAQQKVESLLEARCIFTPDLSIEIPIIEVIREESLITHDKMQEMIRKMIAEEITTQLASEPEPEPEPEPEEPAHKPKKQMTFMDRISDRLDEGETTS